MLETVFKNPDFWRLVSIPVVAGLVGWWTNWLAVKLTFQPLEFIGLRPIFGWQGIIPSKARKMASTFVDSTMSRLGSLPELFEQMEPEALAQQILRYAEPRMDEYTDAVMLERNAVLWENLPGLVKEGVYERSRQSLRRQVGPLVEEIGEQIEDLLDFKHMIVSRLVEDKALLNRLFLESGAREFRFIVRSGLYFGFLFGLVQLAVWWAYGRGWTLPVFGLLVGWATNWIALNLIFRPLHPVALGPWTLQGLFLRRQQEVAAVWCRLVTREILTVQHLVHSLMTGPRSERAREMVRRHLKPLVESSVGPLAQLAVGTEGYARLRQAVGELAVEVSEAPFADVGFNEERAKVVEDLLRERMESLPPDEFQDLLRPCFQEDELKLILLGAALGLLAGLGQLFFVFGAA
ncbi:MAG: hypothetical protein AAF604_09095 [Acidobacteriota bacterium]